LKPEKKNSMTEVSKFIGTATAKVSSTMSQPTIRTWLAAAHCSSRNIKRTTIRSRVLVRHQSTGQGETPRLETLQDWQDFMQTRAKQSHLSTFSNSTFYGLHFEQFLVEVFSQYGSTQNAENTFKSRDALRKPTAHATVSSLLAAGAHFGHATTRMNPNFVPYAYGTRAGITIIDLDQTVPLLRRATNVVRAIARAGGIILFIGTRPDIMPVVQRSSERLGKQGFHVGERWLPGTLTNRRMYFGSAVDELRVIPDLAILLNPLQNMHAIREFAMEHVPTIGVIDSNVDPRIVMYPIPANDESTRAAELIAGILSIAGREGVALHEQDKLLALASRSKKERQNPKSEWVT
jgi:small subunit ribosomal protein S2